MGHSSKKTLDRIVVVPLQTDEFSRLLATYIHRVQSKNQHTVPKWSRGITAALKANPPESAG